MSGWPSTMLPPADGRGYRGVLVRGCPGEDQTVVSTKPSAGRRPVPWPLNRYFRGGGKAGRVCIKRPRQLRDMLLVRDGPDRADLTPKQEQMRRLLLEQPGAFVVMLAALEEQHRAVVREAEGRRRAARPVTRNLAPVGPASPAPAATLPQPPAVRPPADLVARRDDRVVRLFIPGRFLVECLTIAKMRVEGLSDFEVVGCRYDPARGGVVILARSGDFPAVPAGGRIPEWVVRRGKRGRLFCP